MAEIEVLHHHADVFIVKHAISVEPVLLPLSLICDFSTGIVKHASALHSVLNPFSTIFTTLVVIKSSKTVTIMSKFVAFVSPLFEHFAYILGILVNLPLFCYGAIAR